MEKITIEEAIWLLKEFLQQGRKGYIKLSTSGDGLFNDCEQFIKGKTPKEINNTILGH